MYDFNASEFELLSSSFVAFHSVTFLGSLVKSAYLEKALCLLPVVVCSDNLLSSELSASTMKLPDDKVTHLENWPLVPCDEFSTIDHESTSRQASRNYPESTSCHVTCVHRPEDAILL